MAQDGEVYAIKGNRASQMSEPSSANRGGATIEMRTLVELMVMNMLIAQAFEITEDLAKIRQDVSDSIT